MKKQSNNKNMPENDVAMSADDAPPPKKTVNPKKSVTCCCPWKRSNYSHSWLREQRCRRRSTPCTAGTWEFVPRRRRVTGEFLWDRLIDWPHAWKSTPAKFNMEPENQSLLETSIFSFHVKLGGCKLCWKIPTFFFEVVFSFQSKVLREKWWDVSIGQKNAVDWQITM